MTKESIPAGYRKFSSYFEFSKLYCRIMRLEMQMKKKLISSVLSCYKDTVITEFQKFFFNKESKDKKKILLL